MGTSECQKNVVVSNVQLPLIERWGCYLVWTLAAVYSSYSVYVVSYGKVFR